MSSARRATVWTLAATAAAAATGAAIRAAAPEEVTPSCAAAAAGTLFIAAAPVAAAWLAPCGGGRRERFRRLGWVVAATWLAAGAAMLVAGGSSAGVAGAALVPCALAALAAGVAAALGACGVRPSSASFAAAALACAPSALLFVADPWIEWRGSVPPSAADGSGLADLASSPGRAHAVLTASPLAAMTSRDGGLAVDWQRMPILYDGPAPGTQGLSVVGQFYPSTPPSPAGWSAALIGAGALLLLVARTPHGAGGSPPGILGSCSDGSS